MLDTQKIKKDFPIFKNNPGLVYLDSTATSLKPQAVIDRIVEYYSQYSANIHRGIYAISERATEEYELTRNVVAKFINAPSANEIIFTRSTTEAINLIVYSQGRQIVKPDDEIVVSIMEHHSNFVPWQQLAFEVGADFKVIDITDDGYLAVSDRKTPGVGTSLTPGVEEERINLGSIISKKTKILALTYVSNVLGTINPVKEIIAAARKINPEIIIVVDAAQAAPHHKIDVVDLDCDFLAFSSHKMLGPTGVGILWGKSYLLEKMFPFNYGGDMVEEVYIDKTIFRSIPSKFEAGTPHIAGVIGFGAAIEYLNNIGLKNVYEHEQLLVTYAMEAINHEFGESIKIVGPKNPRSRVGIMAFILSGCHPHDVAYILDQEGIAIRVGFHCAMPLHTRLKTPATNRVSFYLYNNEEDVEKLIAGLKKARKTLL